MKALKIITLPITVPLAFISLGVIGVVAFVVLLFDPKLINEFLENNHYGINSHG